MTELGSAWTEVGNELNALAMKLKLHYEQAAGEEAENAKAALSRLRDALDDAFDAVGQAATDPAIRDDVKRVGASMGDALGATFAQVGSELSKALRRPKE